MDDPRWKDAYLIWSFEHDAWWAPEEMGYVRTWPFAGVYTQARAAEICDKANIVEHNETYIPLSAVAREL